MQHLVKKLHTSKIDQLQDKLDSLYHAPEMEGFKSPDTHSHPSIIWSFSIPSSPQCVVDAPPLSWIVRARKLGTAPCWIKESERLMQVLG